MKNVRIISRVLFYITRLLAFFYLAITFYAAISIASGWSLLVTDNERRFSVCYPFSETPFLNGENIPGYILFGFLLPLGFYGAFFLLTSVVFKIFFQPRLFTEESVGKLQYFYLLNIIALPVILLCSKITTGKIEEGLDIAAVVHFILGIFAYFLTAIFRQGLQLQTEQDLFI